MDFWVSHGMNVMFEGRRGVGKTAVVKDCFTRNGLRWKYFSAATMDPWVDFCGIPRAVTKDGREVLEFVLSPDFADDKVDALFFDEFNRAHKKVRDAVMELIQFKSINGRQFKNLKIVWAAINPPEEDGEKYQVEEMDPAILDRFHVHVHMPYKPDRKFFEEIYAQEGRAAVDWWNEQPEPVQRLISPRRLEYAVKASIAGNIGFVFPEKVDSASFLRAIKSGSLTDMIKRFIADDDTAGAKTWLKNTNHLDMLITSLKSHKTWWSFYLPLIPQERMTTAMTTNRPLLKYLVDNEKSIPIYATTLNNFESSTGDRKVLKWLRENRTVVGSGQFANMHKTMRISGNTYERMHIIAGLVSLAASIPTTEYDQVRNILKVFIARTQKFTLTAYSSVSGIKGSPINAIKKIVKVIGVDTELTELVKSKGMKTKLV